MPRPICVECEIEYRPEKNGVIAEEMATGIGSYKIWHADLWKCPVCGHLLISGYGQNAIAEHYQSDYKEQRLAEVRAADGHAYLFYDRVPKEEPEDDEPDGLDLYKRKVEAEMMEEAKEESCPKKVA